MTSKKSVPTLYLFAGSNGAGKSTFARAYLTTAFEVSPRFLNADEMLADSPHLHRNPSH